MHVHYWTNTRQLEVEDNSHMIYNNEKSLLQNNCKEYEVYWQIMHGKIKIKYLKIYVIAGNDTGHF